MHKKVKKYIYHLLSRICSPFVSLLVSALFGWPYGISVHLLPRSVTACVGGFRLAMWHIHPFVSQVCHCWDLPISVGHVAFLFICLPGLLSALCVTGVRRLSVLFSTISAVSIQSLLENKLEINGRHV